jgi:hypothetical protein
MPLKHNLRAFLANNKRLQNNIQNQNSGDRGVKELKMFSVYSVVLDFRFANF